MRTIEHQRVTCPACKSKKIKQTSRGKKEGMMWRYWVCLECPEKFRTLEVDQNNCLYAQEVKEKEKEEK